MNISKVKENENWAKGLSVDQGVQHRQAVHGWARSLKGAKQV
jgi:hypothetical protein